MRSRRLVGGLLPASLLAWACAGQAPASAPSQQYSPAPELLTDDVGQLERDLDQNERVLLAQLGAAAPSAGALESRQAEEKASAPTAPPPATRAAPKAADEAAPAGAGATEPTGPCAEACRAFGSMQRSAGRICELTGAEHERCTRARERVSTAQTRLSRAGCVCR